MQADTDRRHDLRFELRVALTLHPGGLQSVWRADLVGDADDAAMHFDSLPSLIRYLARLDRPGPPPRGIR